MLFYFSAEVWFLSSMTTAFKTEKLYMWLKFENYGDKWKAEGFFSSWINFVTDVKFTVQYYILFYVYVSDFRFSCFSPCV